MNKKIKRYLDDEERMEVKIAEMQEQLKGIQTARQEEENREIVKDIRNLKLSRRELFELLCGLEDGSITLSKMRMAEAPKQGAPFPKEQGNHRDAMNVAEREDKDGKEEVKEVH